MSCKHEILRRSTRGIERGVPWDRIPVWKCLDCDELFDIKQETLE